jgi:hypothetical protein
MPMDADTDTVMVSNIVPVSSNNWRNNNYKQTNGSNGNATQSSPAPVSTASFASTAKTAQTTNKQQRHQ